MFNLISRRQAFNLKEHLRHHRNTLKLTELVDDRGHTALTLAVKQKEKELVEVLFEAATELALSPEEIKTWVNKKTTQGQHSVTALHIASSEGPSDIVHLLLQKAADPHMLDEQGRSVLHHAAIGCNIYCIVYFCEKESMDINCLDNSKQTPLHKAAQYDQKPTIDYILSIKGANIEAQDSEGKTALMLSVI